VTGANLQPIADTQAALARLLLGVGLSVGAASLFGGWLLAGRALRPVDRLIDDAAALGPDDLERRLAQPPRMDEVGRLTLTLNGMLDRIAESVERQRLFVAMASHELRTPLAALRAELDIVERDDASLTDYREALHEAQGDAIRLASLATSLLDLATTREDAHSISRTPVRLRQLARSVVRSVDPLARQRGVVIELDMPDEVVWVDRTRIEHALGNLLNNAVSYSSLGGEVEVHGRIEGEPDGHTLTVEVLDRGPGIGDDPPDELFAPFHRGAYASGAGSGLGLATVAGAVRAHDGTFGAGNRDGAGARFWFAVPCDRADLETSDVQPGSDPVGAKAS
jgi:signal transduction histidine kinase